MSAKSEVPPDTNALNSLEGRIVRFACLWLAANEYRFDANAVAVAATYARFVFGEPEEDQ